MRHLAIRAPNWVGDLVMSTPVLAAAMDDARFERVSVLVRQRLVPLLEDGPLEPALVPIPAKNKEVEVLRGLRPDGILLLTDSIGSAWRARRAGIATRAGSAVSGRRVLLTHGLAPPMGSGRRLPIPTAHHFRDVAGLFGIQVPDLHPRLAHGPATDDLARRLLVAMGLAEGEPYVLCSPGASFGAAKLWPPERFAGVLDALHRERGWRGVVIGGPGEEALMAAVVDAAHSGVVSPLSTGPADPDRCGLAVTKALVSRARLLLVGDTGPRWIAVAYGTPCVSVMGPSHPGLTASSLEGCSVIRVAGLECSPCGRRKCPLGHHRCMQAIQGSDVLGAIEALVPDRAESSSASAGACAAEPLR